MRLRRLYAASARVRKEPRHIDGNVAYGSRVDGALARAFLTLLQHWSGAVTCPACLCGGCGRWP